MKVSRHKPGKPYDRRVHLDGKEWSWRISKANVWIRSSDGKLTIRTDAYEMNGMTYDDWADEHKFADPERGYPMCPTVTPSLVLETIQNMRRDVAFLV